MVRNVFDFASWFMGAEWINLSFVTSRPYVMESVDIYLLSQSLWPQIGLN